MMIYVSFDSAQPDKSGRIVFARSLADQKVKELAQVTHVVGNGLLRHTALLASLYIAEQVVIAQLRKLRETGRLRPTDKISGLANDGRHRRRAIAPQGQPLAELRIIQGHGWKIERFVHNGYTAGYS